MNYKLEQEQIRSLEDLKAAKKRSRVRSNYLEHVMIQQLSATKDALVESVSGTKQSLLNPLMITGAISMASKFWALKSNAKMKANNHSNSKLWQFGTSILMKLISRYLNTEKIEKEQYKLI